MTDRFPLETSWTLFHSCGSSTTGTTVSGPMYTAALTMHSTKLCLPGCTSLYKFTIFDSNGDGLCCKRGNGQYEILVDGSMVLTGGEFSRSEMKMFGPKYENAKLALKEIWAQKNLRPGEAYRRNIFP